MKKLVALLLMLALLMVSASALAEADVPHFKITLRLDTLVTDYDDNYFTNWIEEAYGCTLEFQFLPANEHLTKLSVMIASGEDLGDLLFYPTSADNIFNFADAAAIIPLNEYYEKYDTNLERLSEEIGVDLLAQITAADGNVYSMPIYVPESNNMTAYRAWINQTWLDNLGLEMPTTPDELYDVLVAFRDQDANGNGDTNDEIPMLGCSSSWTCNPVVYLTNAFVRWDEGLRLNIEDGVISAAYAREEYREALRFINKLVAEGLLATDTFSISHGQYQEYLNTDISTVGIHFYTHLGDMDTTRDNHKEYEYLPYLTGYDGVRRVFYQPYNIVDNQVFFITSNCEDPDAAFRLIDWLFSVDSYIHSRFGFAGVHHDQVTDPETLEILGSDHEFAILEYDNGWGKSGNMSWHHSVGYYTGSSYMCQWNGDPSYYFYKRLVAVNDMLEQAPKTGEYVPSLTFNVEENAEVIELWNNISTYWSECQTLFILNEMSVDSDWDSYIDTLNGLGLERLMELYQTAYDRTYG